jgi:hypothetical protein
MVQKIHFMLSHYLFIRDLFLSLPELLSFHVFFFTFLYLHSIFFEQLVLFRPIVMGKLLSWNRLQSGLVPLNYLRQVKVNLLRRKIVFTWWAADAPSRNLFFFNTFPLQPKQLCVKTCHTGFNKNYHYFGDGNVETTFSKSSINN